MQAPDSAEQGRRETATGAWIGAVVACAFWGIGAVLSLVPAAMTVMMFDAPGSQDRIEPWALLVSMWSFPVLCVLSIVGVLVVAVLADRAARRGNRRLRSRLTAWLLVLAALPLASIIAVVAVLAIAFE